MADLIPDFVIDTFYFKIQASIENGEDYGYLMDSMKKLNGGNIPDRISKLISERDFKPSKSKKKK